MPVTSRPATSAPPNRPAGPARPTPPSHPRPAKALGHITLPPTALEVCERMAWYGIGELPAEFPPGDLMHYIAPSMASVDAGECWRCFSGVGQHTYDLTCFEPIPVRFPSDRRAA